MKNRNNHYVQQAYQNLWSDNLDNYVFSMTFNNFYNKSILYSWEDLNSFIDKNKPKFYIHTRNLFSSEDFIPDHWDKKVSQLENDGFSSIKNFINDNKEIPFYKKLNNNTDLKKILEYFLLTYVRSKYFLCNYLGNVHSKKEFDNLKDKFISNHFEILTDYRFCVIKHTEELIYSELNMLYRNFNNGLKPTLFKMICSKLNLSIEDNNTNNILEEICKHSIFIVISPTLSIFGFDRRLQQFNNIIVCYLNCLIENKLFYYNLLTFNDRFVLKRNSLIPIYKFIIQNDLIDVNKNLFNGYINLKEIYKSQIQQYILLPED